MSKSSPAELFILEYGLIADYTQPQEDQIPGGHVALLRAKTAVFGVGLAHRTVSAEEVQAAVGTTVTQRTVRNRFCLVARDGPVLVRRRPGERFQLNCLRPRYTGPTPGVMWSGEKFPKIAGVLSWITLAFTSTCIGYDSKMTTASSTVTIDHPNIVYDKTFDTRMTQCMHDFRRIKSSGGYTGY
ncbi:transposable element Tcb2 transposase [Trichonephila clavipes]|nr:transposable element Tcb2 transposase [Trichonephila clavipes]